MVHPHSILDLMPDCASLICSNADHPMKRKSKKSVQGEYVNQYVLQENKSSISKRECQANVIEDDKNCQFNLRPVKKTVCDGKKANLPSFTRIQCVLTRTVNIPSLCGQSSQQIKSHVISGQCQDQQNYNLSTGKRIQWSKDLYILTRTVKEPQMIICGQRSQQKNYVICGQWPDQIIRSQFNQHVTRTVKLSDVIRKAIQCLMTRTLNQPKVFTCGQQWNQVICSYQNQHYHTSTKVYVVRRTVNLQDATRKSVQWDHGDDKNCQSAKHMCCDKKCHVKSKGTHSFSYAVSAKDCLKPDWDTAWNN